MATGCGFLDQKETGERFIYDEQGALREHYYMRNGVKNGEYEMYYRTGDLREQCEYDSLGRRTGVRKLYYRNGQKQLEESYKDGVRVGDQLQWDEQGNLVSSRAAEQQNTDQQ